MPGKMKFVNNLQSVKPNEIVHVNREKPPVVGIVHCPDARAYQTYIVVYKDGTTGAYNERGLPAPHSQQNFRFKPTEIETEVELEVYTCPSCGFVAIRYDSGHPFVKTHERVIDCLNRDCGTQDIGLFGTINLEINLKEGEGLE